MKIFKHEDPHLTASEVNKKLWLAWLKLLEKSELKDKNAEVFDDLVLRYNSPTRKYHGLTHIQETLFFLKNIIRIKAPTIKEEEIIALFYAVFFHDVIYVPGQKNNEALSADYAREKLQIMNASNDLIKEVERLIMLTANHVCEENDTPGKILCDADKMILSAFDDEYISYVQNLRQEYSIFSDEHWKIGRAAWINTTLNSKKIYYFSDEFIEEQARHNLCVEREKLLAI